MPITILVDKPDVTLLLGMTMSQVGVDGCTRNMFYMFFQRSMIDGRFRWTSCLFSRQGLSIGWCRKLSMTGINTSGFWDVYIFLDVPYLLLEYFFRYPSSSRLPAQQHHSLGGSHLQTGCDTEELSGMVSSLMAALWADVVVGFGRAAPWSHRSTARGFVEGPGGARGAQRLKTNMQRGYYGGYLWKHMFFANFFLIETIDLFFGG